MSEMKATTTAETALTFHGRADAAAHDYVCLHRDRRRSDVALVRHAGRHHPARRREAKNHT